MVVGSIVLLAIGLLAGGFAAWAYKWGLLAGILVSVAFAGIGSALIATRVVEGLGLVGALPLGVCFGYALVWSVVRPLKQKESSPPS